MSPHDPAQDEAAWPCLTTQLLVAKLIRPEGEGRAARYPAPDDRGHGMTEESERQDMLEVAAAQGWPRLALPSARTIAGTEEAWAAFAKSADDLEVLMARILLFESWARRLGDCPLSTAAALPEDTEV